MKKYSKAELEEMAGPYFDSAHSTDMLLATEDGNFFYPNAKGSAQAHARRNGIEILEIPRPEAEEKAPEPAKVKKVKATKGKAKTKEVTEAPTEAEASEEEEEASDEDAETSDEVTE